MTTTQQIIDEGVEEMFDTVYPTGEQPNLNKHYLTTYSAILVEAARGEERRKTLQEIREWANMYPQSHRLLAKLNSLQALTPDNPT